MGPRNIEPMTRIELLPLSSHFYLFNLQLQLWWNMKFPNHPRTSEMVWPVMIHPIHPELFIRRAAQFSGFTLPPYWMRTWRIALGNSSEWITKYHKGGLQRVFRIHMHPLIKLGSGYYIYIHNLMWVICIYIYTYNMMCIYIWYIYIYIFFCDMYM